MVLIVGLAALALGGLQGVLAVAAAYSVLVGLLGGGLVLAVLGAGLAVFAVLFGYVLGAGTMHVTVREVYQAAGLPRDDAEHRARQLLRHRDPAALLLTTPAAQVALRLQPQPATPAPTTSTDPTVH